MFLPVFLHGLSLGLGLIVAIGAQNAFVLRQGLRNEHVLSVVTFCALADAALISAGVMGMAQVLEQHSELARALALAGAAFLTVYGCRAFQRAGLGLRLKAAVGTTSLSRRSAILQAAAFTFLNPHVYLDTVLLMGGIGAQHASPSREWFILGASTASLCWFLLLGFGARSLAPVFGRPRSWQVLDGLIGLTMWVLAALLLRHVTIDI